MKVVLCYYSITGNTRLACEFIASKLNAADVTLFNLAKNSLPDFGSYDAVGFAAYADFGGASRYLHNLFGNIPHQGNKPAFVFNTYGCMSMGTLKDLSAIVTARGFEIINGFSLHTPENYPPMRKSRMAFDSAPKPKAILKLESRVDELNSQLADLANGNTVTKRFHTGVGGRLGITRKRSSAKKDFGRQVVDPEKCNSCGKCLGTCPAEAIRMDTVPVFNHDLCDGCWGCYNICPQQAIRSRKMQGEYQYRGPSQLLKDKLS